MNFHNNTSGAWLHKGNLVVSPIHVRFVPASILALCLMVLARDGEILQESPHQITVHIHSMLSKRCCSAQHHCRWQIVGLFICLRRENADYLRRISLLRKFDFVNIERELSIMFVQKQMLGGHCHKYAAIFELCEKFVAVLCVVVA